MFVEVLEPIPRELQSSWVFLCSKAENGFQVGEWVRDVNLVGQIAGDWIAALKTWVFDIPEGNRCSRILLSLLGFVKLTIQVYQYQYYGISSCMMKDQRLDFISI